MILLIDNYDSFVFNLARYLRRLGHETLVVRNDATSPAEVLDRRPDAIVLSPGPCTPSEAGCCSVAPGSVMPARHAPWLAVACLVSCFLIVLGTRRRRG